MNLLIKELKNNNEDSFVGDILKFVISIILIAFIAFMWKQKNEEELKESTKLEGYSVIQYTKSCIDGKQFINAGRGITINLDMDGKPIPCNSKE